MRNKGSNQIRMILVWAALVTAVAVPIIAAAASPLLAWREPIYIAAGLAGIIALALLLVQPLLAGGYLAGLSTQRGRRAHRIVGSILVVAVTVHVSALWFTSPPDVVDALLFRSPTPFSFWGVIAMWAVFAAAIVAALRWHFLIRQQAWRLIHTALAVVIVLGSVIHALLIVGTMEPVSKIALCVLIVAATVKAIADLPGWVARSRRGL